MSLRKRTSSNPRVGLPRAMQTVGDARDVAAVDRVDQPEQIEPLLAVELTDEAEIQEDDLIGDRVGEDVPGVRIAVEEPIDEDLLDDRPDEHRSRVRTCRRPPPGARRPSRS